jgi:tRNA(fMet)-specific endonuclease VapC
MEVTALVLCDSDVIIEFLNRNEEVAEKIYEFGIHNICISAVSVNEVLLGAVNKIDFQRLNKWLSQFIIIDITTDISVEARELILTYGLSHKPSIPDMLIAATALSLDIELFTLNLSDFKFINHLRLIDHNIKPKRIGR